MYRIYDSMALFYKKRDKMHRKSMFSKYFSIEIDETMRCVVFFQSISLRRIDIWVIVSLITIGFI